MKITKCEKANCPNNALYSRGTKRYGAVCLGAKCHINKNNFAEILAKAVSKEEYDIAIKKLGKEELEALFLEEPRKTGQKKIKQILSGFLNAK